MKFLSAAAIALLLLAGCSTTPDPPSTHPTWCNKDPKKEPHFHCNGSVYLPGHEPEECIPEEPEVVVQKPLEPPKVDPIIGTYKVFHTDPKNIKQVEVWRIQPDHFVNTTWAWRRFGWEKYKDEYRLGDPDAIKTWPWYLSVKYQTKVGEPDIVLTHKWVADDSDRGIPPREGIKLSSDPDYKFDFFRVGGISKGKDGSFGCANIGSHERTGYSLSLRESDDMPDQYADTIEECEALCPAVLAEFKRRYPDHPHYETLTCPQDRR